MADSCTHPRLVHIENIEMSGEQSTTYQCEKCQELLTVTISPLAPVGIRFGPPPARKP
jgi:hypothetical protein